MSTSRGHGNDSTGGVPAEGIAGDVLGATGTTSLSLEPEEVLAAASIVSDRAEALSAALMAHETAMRIDPPSENEVSANVATAWNAAVVDGDDSQLGKAKAYLRTLQQLALQLREAAQRYQLNEDCSADAFEDRGAAW